MNLRLPSQVWVVQAGMFVNYLGWGCVMPFEVIYLHDGRGFSLAAAGLVVGVVTGLAVVAAPVSGPVIDRVGARVTAAGAGVALAAGYGGLAIARTPAQALVAAAAAGVGNGAMIPSQSALIASLVPAELRHRATAVSRVASNLGGALGSLLGGFVAAHGLTGFVTLYFANAATYLVYVAILLVLVRADVRPEPLAGGYRLLLRDPAFVRLAGANVAVIGVGWGMFTWIVPAYAHDQLDIGSRLIGTLIFANGVAVVIAQLPVARFAEGRSRTVSMATGALVFAAASLIVAGAAFLARDLAYVAVLTAAFAVGVGECFYTVAMMPLVADLAPPAIRGRYMGAIGLSWWLGLSAAPTLGAQLLSVSATGVMLASAGVAAAAAVSLLALEHELPAAIRATPRPG